jgi:hypothetical protein
VDRQHYPLHVGVKLGYVQNMQVLELFLKSLGVALNAVPVKLAFYLVKADKHILEVLHCLLPPLVLSVHK